MVIIGNSENILVLYPISTKIGARNSPRTNKITEANAPKPNRSRSLMATSLKGHNSKNLFNP